MSRGPGPLHPPVGGFHSFGFLELAGGGVGVQGITALPRELGCEGDFAVT